VADNRYTINNDDLHGWRNRALRNIFVLGGVWWDTTLLFDGKAA